MSKRRTNPSGTTPTRKQLSRRAKEERQRTRLYISAAVLAVLLVSILAFGLYDEFVQKPRRAVALVEGVQIRNDHYQRMLEYTKLNLNQTIFQLQEQLATIDPNNKDQEFIAQYYQQQVDYTRTQLDSAPAQVLNDLIDDELVRQEAERLGLTVSDDEIQTEIESVFGFDPDPPTPTPTPVTSTLPITVTPTPTLAPMTEEEFKQRYDEYVNSLLDALKPVLTGSSAFTEADFRALFRRNLLRDKLEEYLAAQLPTTELQVKASHILVETEEEAKAALERLQAGEDFATVAQEMSTDEGTRESGGDLGWFPAGQMVAEFEKVAFNTPAGQISEIVQTDFGFHIIKVEGRDENRELDPAVLSERQSNVVVQWLEEKKLTANIERLIEVAEPALPG